MKNEMFLKEGRMFTSRVILNFAHEKELMVFVDGDQLRLESSTKTKINTAIFEFFELGFWVLRDIKEVA